MAFAKINSHRRPNRWAGLVATLAFAGAGFAAAAPAQAADGRTPVLVELFTSEGCSDCPPADALLARLDQTQFVPGADAIVLSEHVTYWNHDGWTDPFSFDQMTFRQAEYQRSFGLSSSYTPQMVVDGAVQMVGSNVPAVTQAIAQAAEKPQPALTIGDAHWSGRKVQFTVHGPADSKANLIAVLAENATLSDVKRGENAGRTLKNVAVVRVLKDFGSKAINAAADGRPLELSADFHPLGATPGEPIRLVVFLANRRNGHVQAVAEQTLTEAPSASPAASTAAR
ncbi:MAG: DUF1223 domain-containing protein [Terracidiphilus sp.]